MAAITLATTAQGSGFRRTGTAQANTGQTDWLQRPAWASYMIVLLDITAVAGTTPIVTPAILAADPITADDANTVAVWQGATPPTAASTHYMQFGPGVTGIADDTTLAAAADSVGSGNIIIPDLVGVQLVLDRTTGDETYTYTLNVTFRR